MYVDLCLLMLFSIHFSGAVPFDLEMHDWVKNMVRRIVRISVIVAQIGKIVGSTYFRNFNVILSESFRNSIKIIIVQFNLSFGLSF